MTTAHQSEVHKLANELQAAADAELAADPGVQEALAQVEAARRALNFDRHNPERQQHLRDAEKGWRAATNTYHHNLKMARIQADKAEKKLKADAMQAAADARRKEAEEMTPIAQEMLKRYRSVL